MDPYSTHLPILASLGPNGHRHILELGAGAFSTPLFLDRSKFPAVESVLSIEHDEEWAKRVRAANTDPRLSLSVVPEPIEPFLDSLDLGRFDLIFVDNSDKPERRIETIKWIAGHATTQVVVLHDLEREDYRAAADGFRHLVVYSEHTPYTGVATNG